MADDFEADVKQVNAKHRPKSKLPKDPNLEQPREEKTPARPEEESPLRTAKGTPIIERSPEG